MNRSTWTVAVLALTACGFVAATTLALAAEEKKDADKADRVDADKSKNLLKEPNKAESWRLEQHEKGKGEMKADEDAILFDVTTAGDESWHVQAYVVGLDLKDGKEYTFTYKAKGDPARTVTAVSGINEIDWHTIGLQEDVEVGKDWKEHKQTFTASNVNKNKNNRIGFLLAAGKGKVWIKDASLTEKE